MSDSCDSIACSLPGSSVQSKNTGVGSHSLFQGIFPTQGSHPGLYHYRQTLYHLSHQGSPINIWGTFKNLILKQCLCMVVTIILSTENLSLQSLRNKPKIIQIIDDRKWKWKSDSLQPHGLNSLWNSPGQNTGVGSFSLLLGIFPTQGSHPGLPHCRQILYQLSHKGSPRILKWVAYPFSKGSSSPRNWTWVSCIAGRFFTNWDIREAQMTGLRFKYRST